MARSQFVHRLVRKYREIASQIDAPGVDPKPLKASLGHLRATILLFEPGYPVAELGHLRPYRRAPGVRHGSYIRTALAILRESPVPLTMRQIAGHTLRARGVRSPSRDEIEKMMRGMNGKIRHWAESDGAYPARFTLPNRER